MLTLLALHAAVGAGIVGFGERLGRRAVWPALIAPVATLAWLATEVGGVLDGGPVEQRVNWVPALGLDLDLRLDGLGVLMVLLVSGIGVAVLLYAVRYFPAEGTPALGRLLGLLVVFSGAMLGVVLADNLLLLAVCWELTSVSSYLLIGNSHTKAPARAAALQALLITGSGGLVMLVGFVLVGQAGGTYRISDLVRDPPSGTGVTVGLMLVLVGAFTKSAQYPFHSWLPRAMVAPTPVSAYLHSATMVKAGVYLIARLAPGFALAPGWRPVVCVVGLTTMVAGGLRALRQNDLKLLLAFGTVSQLGFMVVLFGVGVPEATAAGCTLLLAHGLFKAALFMVVGILDHETGTRDRRELPALGPTWLPIKVITVASAASMAGVPLLLGFVAKESGYAALADADFGWAPVALGTAVVASVVTFAYSARIVRAVLVAPAGVGLGDARGAGGGRRPGVPGPASTFVAPAAVLAAATIVLGLVPSLADRLIDAASNWYRPGLDPVHLSLWHGFNLPLLLSAATIGAGLVVVASRRPIERFQAVGERVPTGTDAYLLSLRGLRVLAVRVTAVVQNGSLPVYTGVILLTAAVLPGGALLLFADWPGWPDLVDSPAHLPVAVVLIGAALAAAIVRRRFSAALFLGTAGYAMAGLFVVQGAPDLALTQAAIETLTTVLFVLVLRRLPDRFERKSGRTGRLLRATIATAVGATVFAFALVAGSARTAEPVSIEMVERSLPDAKGRNVVNVILVDFRGFDTMGEITVLASAAIGAVALARATRHPRPPGRRDGGPRRPSPAAASGPAPVRGPSDAETAVAPKSGAGSPSGSLPA